MDIYIKRLKTESDSPLPEYQTVGSSGMDVHAFLKEPVEIPCGKLALIPTGLSVAIPQGFEIQVRPRSGLALKHGVTVLNTPGTIDADYRGEVGVILANLGEKPFVVENKMRIAQLVLSKVETINWVEVDSLPETKRGTGGFGHTNT